MKSNKHYIKFLLTMGITMLVFLCVKAQDQTPANTTITLSGTTISGFILGENEKPLSDAKVSYGEGVKTVFTDKRGFFKFNVQEISLLKIDAKGYELKIIDNFNGNDKKIILKKSLIGLAKEDLVQVPFGQAYKRNLVGAVSIIKGKDMESAPDASLTNSLAGKAAGMVAMQTAGTPGWNAANLYVRGLARDGDNGPLIIVDGIERPMNDLNAEEIEDVQILKDATSKILYGARGANGVIMVTTKRGEKYSKDIKVNVEYGMKTPTQLPKFLNSADYATLFNEARKNDGLPDYYSQKDIDGYRSGTDPVRYPDVDYYNELLNKSMPFRKAVAQFKGGNNRAQYYLNMGYVGEGGLEKAGPPTTFDRINIRANLNYDISKNISMYLDAVGRMEFRSANNMSSQDFFGRLSNHRPNEYPLVISKTADSIIYGGSYYSSGNVYAQMEEGGYRNRTDRTGQTNAGFNFKLNELLQGLSAKAYITFDVYNYINTGKNQNFYSFVPVYTTTPTGDVMTIQQLTIGNKVANQSLFGDDGYRNLGYSAQLNYNRTFNNKHAFNSDLIFFRNKRELRGSTQDIKNETWAWRTNYAYNNKYIAEIDLTALGSSKFMDGNQYGFFPAVGAAWILSEENFLKQSKMINYLKLKASFGVLGTDRNIGFYQFEDRWNRSGNANFGANNETRPGVTNIETIGNKDISWEKSQELNVGMESQFFNNALAMEINYFRTNRYDILSNRYNNYPRLLGGVLPLENFGKILNTGIEADINYTRSFGDFKAVVGANMVWSKAINKQYDDLVGYADYRRRTNQAVDAVFGYTAIGLFHNQTEIQNSPLQHLGPVSPGDIRYLDINGDNRIDQNDEQIIGNTFPRVTYGINLDLQFKKFGLIITGTGNTAFNRFNNNSYYFINDLNKKYSEAVLNRWTPQTAETATYPRLTTLRGTNNYRNSTYWLTDAGFFRLKSAELNYLIVKNGTKALKNAKIFVRGNNLFLLSKIKDLDPEDMSAGLTDFPIFTTITTGLQVTF